MEELCHYPGKGGQAWQGHGPSVGGGGGADNSFGDRGDPAGGCDGGFEDRRDAVGGVAMVVWGTERIQLLSEGCNGDFGDKGGRSRGM